MSIVSEPAIGQGERTSFDQLAIPLDLGTIWYEPAIESVKKLSYAVEDESGWLVGDPADGMVHPHFLSAYMWWPSGFYHREPWARGLFATFHERYPWLVGRPFLHAKTRGRFHAAFRAGTRIRADVTVVEKYRRRSRDFIVMRARFHDAGERLLAEYDHTVAIRSDPVERPAERGSKAAEQAEAAPAPGRPLPQRRIEMSLEKSRLFTLPTENYHTHDAAAQAMGLRVAVPAAMMSFGYLSKHCRDFFGPAWTGSGDLDVVFTRMLARDDVLTVHGSVRGTRSTAQGVRTEIDVGIRNARGEAVAVAVASALTTQQRTA